MRSVIAILLVLVIDPFCFAEPPVADGPTFSPGDMWVYAREDGKKIKLEYLRTEGGNNVFLKNGKKEVVLDDRLSDIGRKSQGRFPGPIIDFPLSEGKTWEYAHKAGKYAGPDITRGRAERVARYEVVGYGPVTVPAGTFQAFRIDVTVRSATGEQQMKGTHTYWYAPAVKMIVKSSEFRIGEMELVKYKVK